MPIPSNDLLTLAPDAIIDLYVLDLSPLGENQEYRFCNWKLLQGREITFQKKIYTAIPLSANGFELNSRGQMPTPKIEFGNTFGVITSFAIAFDDLIGTALIRKRTLAKYLDGFPTGNENMEFTPDKFTVYRKAEENELKISFELRRPLDMGFQSKLPARVILKNACPWIYRSAECSYAGGPVADENDFPTNDPAKDKCGKRLSSCWVRFGRYGQLPYGGFPGVDD